MILTGMVAVLWWRGPSRPGLAESSRLGLLVAGGVLGTLFAAYWGLLVP